MTKFRPPFKGACWINGIKIAGIETDVCASLNRGRNRSFCQKLPNKVIVDSAERQEWFSLSSVPRYTTVPSELNPHFDPPTSAVPYFHFTSPEAESNAWIQWSSELKYSMESFASTSSIKTNFSPMSWLFFRTPSSAVFSSFVVSWSESLGFD